LRKLEKWGVLRGVRDPAEGRLAFKPNTSKASEIISEELRRRVKEIANEISKHIALKL